MARLDSAQLGELLEKHRLWNEDDPTGERLELRGVSLAGVVCPKRHFWDALLVDVDLSGADLRDAGFSGAQLEGVTFCDAQLAGACFSRARLTCCSFDRAQLAAAEDEEACRASDFQHAELSHVSFRDSVLRGAEFTDAQLKNVSFDRADLRRAVFVASQVADSSFVGADLSHSVLSKPSFQNVTLQGASLHRARVRSLWGYGLIDLSGADLSHANFMRPHLDLLDLRSANLSNSYFTFGTIKAAYVHGTWGLPFVFDATREPRFVFSERIDDADGGDVRRFARQLGDKTGRARFGAGLGAAHYCCPIEGDRGDPRYVIESTLAQPHAESIRVMRVFTTTEGEEQDELRLLNVEYRLFDERFRDREELAHELIRELVLRGQLLDEYRKMVDLIRYVNLEGGSRLETYDRLADRELFAARTVATRMMNGSVLALELGVLSSLLALAARRVPLLGWIALTPLGLALSACGGWAVAAGALVGMFVHGSVTLTQPAHLRPLGFVFGGIGWGLTAGGAGLLLSAVRDAAVTSDAVALAIVLPWVPLLATLPMRYAGAPRWIHAALACTQEPWPVIIRVARFGGDATVSWLLAVSACIPCLLVPGATRAPGLAALLAVCVLATVLAAARAQHMALRAIAKQRHVRVAAVVVNGAPPAGAVADPMWPTRSPEYRDVAGTVARYQQHVRRAADQGAELIVLPEAAVYVEGMGVERWLDAATTWARELGVTIVAPYCDPQAPANTLTVIEPSARRWSHDKQHPAPGLEPPPRERQTPGPFVLERGWPLSTAICVDLDYPDLVAPLRAAGGILVVPANDWEGFEELHDRSAVWAAVLSDTAVIRATGHGLCSARDGTGRLLARTSSLAGPAVMVFDVPLSAATV
jgi:uncharacterized protein YjbI with pentapeptide repeats